MKSPRLPALLMFAGVVAAPAAQAQVSRPADALSLQLFGKTPAGGKAHACFKRTYDARHLAGHPQQNVTIMLMLVSYEPQVDATPSHSVKLGVSFRGRKQKFETGGTCSSGAGLNCGVDCDGGSIEVAIRDGKSVLVKIPDGARVWRPGVEEEDANSNKRFGADDKVFRLDRAVLTDCLPVVHDAKERAAIRNTR